MKTLLYSLLGISFICAYIPTKVLAQSYTVGVEEPDLIPYSQTVGKVYSGLLKDIMEEFSKSSGLKFTYKPLPIKRLYAHFYDGKLDLKLPSNAYWQSDIKKKRGLKIIYSDPVIGFVDGLFTAKNKVSVDQVKKIGVISGFTPWDYLDHISSGKIKTIEARNLEALLGQVSLGRVDGAYINVAMGNHFLKSNPSLNTISFNKDLPHSKNSYHLSSIKHANVIEQFNKFMKSNSPFMDKVRSKIILD